MFQVTAFFVLCLCLKFNEVKCFIFHENNTILAKSSYKNFGYKVFLQKGEPRSYLFASGVDADSFKAVYLCPLEDINNCNELSHHLINNNEVFAAMNIDGGTNNKDPVLICAPGLIELFKTSQVYHFMSNGVCFYSFDRFDSWTEIAPNSDIQKQIVNSTYYYGLGQAGFSSFYHDKKKDFVLGSPGLYTWRGGIIKMYQADNSIPIQTRQLKPPIEYYSDHITTDTESLDEYDYAGYAVASAELQPNQTSYIFGIPKSYDLMGKVYIQKETTNKPINPTKLYGKVKGSYFGSSICVADINGDGLPDLLIGAPTYAGRTFNEGIVYVYINKKGDFINQPSQELSPSSRNSRNSMFGYSIANLGKITKENFEIIAVAGPYEEEGQGCIYIYGWDVEGLNIIQKIKGKSLKGFGASISKPIHSEAGEIHYVAVGAYKSSTVVVLKSRPIFNYKVRVDTVKHLISYEEKKPFNISYCISLKGGESVETKIIANIDQRLKIQEIISNEEVIIKKTYCKSINVLLDDEVDEKEPISLKIIVKEKECPSCSVANPKYPKEFTHKIPFIYNCGPDNICTPKLEVRTNIESTNLVVGKENSLKVNVDVVNTGEYAYLCNLSMILPNDVQFASVTKNCERDNCQLPNPLKEHETLAFDVNLQKIATSNSFPQQLQFNVKVNCHNYTTDSISVVYLHYKSKFDVETKKGSIIYDANNITSDMKGQYSFSIKNKGPSPVKNYKFTIKVPRKLNILAEEKLFDIFKPTLNGNSLSCADQEYDEEKKISSDSKDESSSNDGELRHAQLFGSTKSNEINCNDPGIECLEISCITTLMKDDDCSILIPFKSYTNKIVKHYDNTFKTVATLIYTEDSKDQMKESIIAFENKLVEQRLLLWIIIGVFVGLLLLTGLIFLLYKKNFFKRLRMEDLKENQPKDSEETMEEQEMDELKNVESK